jgi:Carboxypeptidase regulatory-like domain
MLIFVLSEVIQAQDSAHPLLRGMVVDSRRATLADVLVMAVDTATKVVVKAHTDSAGEFAFTGLSAGVVYLVAVHKSGFGLLGTRITLHPVDTFDLDVMLARDRMTAAAQLLRGTVVDSQQVPLAAARVTAVDDATNTVVFEVRTDSAGRFAFDSLSRGVPYRIVVRSIGYSEGTLRVTPRPGDTLMKFVLVPLAMLTPVYVRAKADREFHDIRAAEIAKATFLLRDAYDIVRRLRPLMLGDPYKGCMTDQSTFTFGPSRTDTSALGKKLTDLDMKMQDPRRFTLGIGGWALSLFKGGGAQIYRKDTALTSANALPHTDFTYPFHLYINGVLHDDPGAKNILSQIPADDIQEMYYIDCLDTTTPQYRNSLMVILKPGKRY